MKKIKPFHECDFSCLTKTFRIMRITVFLMLAVILQTFANEAYSQKTKLSLDYTNTRLEVVLDEIEELSEFFFLANEKLVNLDRSVNLTVENKKIDEILDMLFAGTDVVYTITDRKIILAPSFLTEDAQQQRSVSGKVTDSSGLPLPGVTVVVKGTTQGTVTNVDGDYTLTNLPEDATLVFSFVGMRTQEVVVGNQTTINITMEEETIGLEEVVAIGYGTVKKSDLTGSVTQVRYKEEFSQLPNITIAQTLQGSVAGLNVGITETAGANPDISIRGLNTLSTSAADNQPLIVVDGVIYRGTLMDINPKDVESINILKDASSAAIYGSQASNGVIIIETNKGGTISTKPLVTYSNQFSLQVPSNKFVPMGRDELEQWILDCHWERGSRIGPDYLQPNPDYSIAPYLKTTENSEGYREGREFDWFNAFTGNGHIINHNIDVKGKNQGIGYFMSAGFSDTKGFVMNDTHKRYNLRINLDSDINEWLNVGIQSFFAQNDYSGVSPGTDSYFNVQPWAPVYDNEGNYALTPQGSPGAENAFLIVAQDDEDKQSNLFANLYAGIKLPFIKGLNYKINYSHNYRTSLNNRFNPQGANYQGSAYKNNRINYVWSLDNLLTYERSFNTIHNINFTAVFGIEEINTSYTNSSASIFVDQTLGFNRMQAGDPSQFSITSGAEKENSIYSMARLIYNYSNKYLITGTIRRDGFSGFGSEEKIGIFPSLALAWVASEENFFDLEFLDYLKLRTSYGSSGRRGVNRYDTRAIVSSEPSVVFGDGGSTTIGQWISKMANNQLRWETTTGINVGADFGINLMNSRFGVIFDYYSNDTRDILYKIQLPLMTGFSNVMTNIGKVHNHGIEFTINANIIRERDINWDLSFNFSRNRNKIVSILGPNEEGVEEDLVANRLFIGEPQQVIYGYEITGEMWQLSDRDAGIIPVGFAPGTHKIVDQNNDGNFSSADDMKILGYPDPSYRFGIANTLSYKNLSLYFFLNSIQGGKNYYMGTTNPEWNWNNYEFITHGNGPAGGFDYWMPENPNAKYRRLDWSPTYEGVPYDQRNFLRLQDLTISYTFNKDLVSRLSIGNLKVFASGKNLLTITKWEGWDPETGRGIQQGLPVMSSYALGLNIEF